MHLNIKQERGGAHGLSHDTGITMGSSERPEKDGSNGATATGGGEEKRRRWLGTATKRSQEGRGSNEEDEG